MQYPTTKKKEKKNRNNNNKKMPKYLIIDTMMIAQSFLKKISATRHQKIRQANWQKPNN